MIYIFRIQKVLHHLFRLADKALCYKKTEPHDIRHLPYQQGSTSAGKLKTNIHFEELLINSFTRDPEYLSPWSKGKYPNPNIHEPTENKF